MKFRAMCAAGACVVLGTLGQLSAQPQPAPSSVQGQQKYDLLLKGGHVIDPKNGISAARDVAIADGKVAAVASRINANEALKVETSRVSTSRRASSTSTSTSSPGPGSAARTPATTASTPTASRCATP